MASLSVEPSGTGYLGPSSGVVFLRSLLLWNRNVKPNSTSTESTPSPRDSSRASSIPIFPASAVSHQLTSSLIDAYFSNYHKTYPFIHEATFRAQYSELVQRPEKHSWHMLLNTVLAFGAWSIGDEQSDLDDMFYREASRYSHDHSIFESGSLTLVQALVLLSNYVQKRNKPNTGWNYLGLAIRMALSLGFHKEFPKWKISLLQREMRRRVWWGLAVFDCGASITFGRAVLLPGEDIADVHHVLNIQDQLLTPATTEVPPESDEPTIYSSLISQSKMQSTAHSISNRLLSTPPITASEAFALCSVADLWTTSVPWYFRLEVGTPFSYDWYLFGRRRLWWRFWNLKIILTRPMLLRWAARRTGDQEHSDDDKKEKDCRDICVQCAHESIESIDTYVRNNSLSRVAAWYSLYFLFHAAMVPAVCICANPTSPEAMLWKADIDVARALLGSAFSNNILASRCLEIVNRLVPEPASDPALFENYLPPDNNFGIEDFLSWPPDVNDQVNFLGWPDYGMGL